MEKFGILNLLKAIETLTPPPAADKSAETEQASAPARPPEQPYPPPPEKHKIIATNLSPHQKISAADAAAKIFISKPIWGEALCDAEAPPPTEARFPPE